MRSVASRRWVAEAAGAGHSPAATACDRGDLDACLKPCLQSQPGYSNRVDDLVRFLRTPGSNCPVETHAGAMNQADPAAAFGAKLNAVDGTLVSALPGARRIAGGFTGARSGDITVKNEVAVREVRVFYLAIHQLCCRHSTDSDLVKRDASSASNTRLLVAPSSRSTIRATPVHIWLRPRAWYLPGSAHSDPGGVGRSWRCSNA